MNCDYFVDALNDPMFELKVWERAPRRFDAAYKEALNLEMWQQSVKERSTSGQTQLLDQTRRGGATKKEKTL